MHIGGILKGNLTKFYGFIIFVGFQKMLINLLIISNSLHIYTNSIFFPCADGPIEKLSKKPIFVVPMPTSTKSPTAKHSFNQIDDKIRNKYINLIRAIIKAYMNIYCILAKNIKGLELS